MAVEFDIRRLTEPTETELEEIGSFLAPCFKDTYVARLGTGDDYSLHARFQSTSVAGGTRGGYLFVAVNRDNGRIIGCVMFFPPGKEIVGDEEQLSYGFKDYLAELPEDVRQGFSEYMTVYSAIADGILGKEAKQKVWSVNTLAVEPQFQRQGIARALMEAGEKVVQDDRSKIILETEAHNICPIDTI